MFCLHVYLMMPGALRGHKRKLDSLVLELHMVGWRSNTDPCVSWDLNPDPLQEQPVFSAPEPSLQNLPNCFVTLVFRGELAK